MVAGRRHTARRWLLPTHRPALIETPSTTQIVEFDGLAGQRIIDKNRLAFDACDTTTIVAQGRSEEHTSELQSLMRISYAVFCLKKKKQKNTNKSNNETYSK